MHHQDISTQRNLCQHFGKLFSREGMSAKDLPSQVRSQSHLGLTLLVIGTLIFPPHLYAQAPLTAEANATTPVEQKQNTIDSSTSSPEGSLSPQGQQNQDSSEKDSLALMTQPPAVMMPSSDSTSSPAPQPMPSETLDKNIEEGENATMPEKKKKVETLFRIQESLETSLSEESKKDLQKQITDILAKPTLTISERLLLGNAYDALQDFDKSLESYYQGILEIHQQYSTGEKTPESLFFRFPVEASAKPSEEATSAPVEQTSLEAGGQVPEFPSANVGNAQPTLPSNVKTDEQVALKPEVSANPVEGSEANLTPVVKTPSEAIAPEGNIPQDASATKAGVVEEDSAFGSKVSTEEEKNAEKYRKYLVFPENLKEEKGYAQRLVFYFNQAQALRHAQQYELSNEVLGFFQEKDLTQTPAAMLTKAMNHLNLEQYHESILAFRKFLELSPDSSQKKSIARALTWLFIMEEKQKKEQEEMLKNQMKTASPTVEEKKEESTQNKEAQDTERELLNNTLKLLLKVLDQDS